MALPDLSRVLRVPGRLFFAPTLAGVQTGAYPHGGTALGLVRQIAVRVSTARRELVAEEYGLEVVEQLYLSQRWVLVATMRGLDEDAVQRVFPATAAAGGGRRVLQYPGATRAGTRRSDAAIVLGFSPDDLDRHPMVLFHRALPLLEEAAELQLRLDEEAGVVVAFLAIRAADGRAVSVGYRGDLTP